MSSSETGVSCTGNFNLTNDLLPHIPHSNKTIALITYDRGFVDDGTYRNNPRYTAMGECCRENTVHKMEDECALWCEFPKVYDHGGLDFRTCFAAEKRRAENGTIAEGFLHLEEPPEEDMAAIRRPTVVGLGLVALAMSFILLG